MLRSVLFKLRREQELAVFLVHAERTERNAKLITSAPGVLQTPHQFSGDETVS